MPEGYAHSIRYSLEEDFNCQLLEVWPQRLSKRDIIIFRPDLIFVLHGNLVSLEIIRYARKKGVKTALWIIEDPYEIDVHTVEWLNTYDYIFTNELEAVSYYRRDNIYYLPWCTNPEIYYPRSVTGSYQSDICFVGMGFKNRVEILNQIAGPLSKLKVRLIGKWEEWGEELHPLLKGFVMPEIKDPEEVAQYYCGANINLNIHRDPSDIINVNTAGVGAKSPNNRTFDIAGAGGFQIIDNTREELSHFYALDREIVTFNNPSQLLSMIKYYLRHPELRQQIGGNSYFRTISHHTFKNRFDQVFNIINKENRKKYGFHYNACLPK